MATQDLIEVVGDESGAASKEASERLETRRGFTRKRCRDSLHPDFHAGSRLSEAIRKLAPKKIAVEPEPRSSTKVDPPQKQDEKYVWVSCEGELILARGKFSHVPSFKPVEGEFSNHSDSTYLY